MKGESRKKGGERRRKEKGILLLRWEGANYCTTRPGEGKGWDGRVRGGGGDVTLCWNFGEIRINS